MEKASLQGQQRPESRLGCSALSEARFCPQRDGKREVPAHFTHSVGAGS